MASYGSVGRAALEVGYVAQDPQSQLFCPTVEDEVAFGLENAGRPAEETNRIVEDVLRATGLDRYRYKDPHTLSGGEQQICAIAAFLAMNQGILILDEPTSNIDPLGTEQVLDLVRQRIRSAGTTCLIVEHKLDILTPMVDRMAVLHEGQLVLEGEPRQVLGRVGYLEQIGLRPPQVVVLAKRLEELGFSFETLPLTVEEMAAALRARLRHLAGRRISVPRRPRASVASGRPVIVVERLTHKYPDGTVALRGVDLVIREGEFVGIIGQNGSGKTTLVKHFNGLLKPTSGSVVVDGVDSTRSTPEKLARTAGYCFQNPDSQIFCNTVREEVAFGPRNLGVSGAELEERVKEAARRVEIDRWLDVDPYTLSLGLRLRVAVASILAMKPKILIVDEPTTGQDYRRGREIMELISERNREGTTCIVITHDMQLCTEWIPRVVVVREGRIILDGPTGEVFAQPELLRETHLTPPQVTRLGQAMDNLLPPDVLTVEEMVQIIDHLARSEVSPS